MDTAAGLVPVKVTLPVAWARAVSASTSIARRTVIDLVFISILVLKSELKVLQGPGSQPLSVPNFKYRRNFTITASIMQSVFQPCFARKLLFQCLLAVRL